MTDLGRFIAATITDEFVWGQNDCALWCASAVLSCTGFDPAADLRGTYASEVDCKILLSKSGGLMRVIGSRMSGFAPLNGDGVVIAKMDGQMICGIVYDARLNVKTESGLKISDNFRILKGWSW